MALALTQAHPYAEHATHAWIDPLAQALQEAGHAPEQASARATILVSGLRGVALDRYLTGDRQRTDDAAAILITTGTATAPGLRQDWDMSV
jgi:hypothetical protein